MRRAHTDDSTNSESLGAEPFRSIRSHKKEPAKGERCSSFPLRKKKKREDKRENAKRQSSIAEQNELGRT